MPVWCAYWSRIFREVTTHISIFYSCVICHNLSIYLVNINFQVSNFSKNETSGKVSYPGWPGDYTMTISEYIVYCKEITKFTWLVTVVTLISRVYPLLHEKSQAGAWIRTYIYQLLHKEVPESSEKISNPTYRKDSSRLSCGSKYIVKWSNIAQIVVFYSLNAKNWEISNM